VVGSKNSARGTTHTVGGEARTPAGARNLGARTPVGACNPAGAVRTLAEARSPGAAHTRVDIPGALAAGRLLAAHCRSRPAMAPGLGAAVAPTPRQCECQQQ
jgi:hypothetical protein